MQDNVKAGSDQAREDGGAARGADDGAKSARSAEPARSPQEAPSAARRKRSRSARRAAARLRPAAARDLARHRRRAVRTGCTRSSSTATASRRGSTDGKVKLLTRKGLDWTDKFPNVAAAVAELAGRHRADRRRDRGRGRDGVCDFSALQDALKNGRARRFVYYVFDLLHLDGHDLTRAPLIERKAALKRLLDARDRDGIDPLQRAFRRHGSEMLQHACRMTLEGIVSKRARRALSLRPRRDWLKTKCSNHQEFVVVGYSRLDRNARAIGALVLGYYDEGQLTTPAASAPATRMRWRATCGRRLQPLRSTRRRSSNSARKTRPRGHLGRAEAGGRDRSSAAGPHEAWCARRRSRACARTSRRRRSCGRCRPCSTSAPRRRRSRAGGQGGGGGDEDHGEEIEGEGRDGGAGAPQPAPGKPGNRRVRFTHPDRVYWADVGVTKQELADYYPSVWD